MDGLVASRQSLTEALSARGVIPIIGPDMVLVDGPDEASKSVPFYRLVADELLRSNVSTERVRRSVSSIVKTLSSNALSSPVLERLARMRAFDVFISLTPDDFLVEALRMALGGDNVEVVAYSPGSDTSKPVDLAPGREGVAQVFFPLGRSAAGTSLAIHERSEEHT